MLPKLTLICLLSLFVYESSAQPADIFKPDSVKKEINAVQIHSSLHIDGVLNEPEWQLASPSPRFTQIEPYQGEAPTCETFIKVLYNKQDLYIGIFAKDPLGKKAIRAIDFKRDFNFLANDLVTLAFDGFNDRRNAMCFATNAYGVQRDYLSFDDLYFDIDWDGLWKVRTNRTDSGWSAEIEIPWQTLRYKKSTDSVQDWGFNAYRNRRLTNEITAFSPFPRAFSASRMEYAGTLKNLRPPPPKSNIRIQPYLLGAVDNYTGFDSTVKANQSNLKIGGDIKWAINPNNILDLTVNTDFAQADADLQVNNVSQFSVFF
ncbi:MAG: carbohydrate binding family 9 domain-containing protein, partial [Bacteroidetes bacterium]|nr:carbohydrate binding family 9 domain-containing protein [Bacteroidota bacterium]